MRSGRWTRNPNEKLGRGLAARRLRWRSWRIRAMRRSKRFKSMARLSRTSRHLATRLWRASPWLLLAGVLLAASLTAPASDQVHGIRRWLALASAMVAPIISLILEPPRRAHPTQASTALAYAVVIGLATYVASVIVVPRSNTFYSVSLLIEGTLLLFALHAAQAALRHISPPPATAAPRTADAFVDGVRVLLIGFFASTAANWLPIAALALALALGFGTFAVIFRAPGALAQLVKRES